MIQMLVTFVLFGDERPDFTGMQTKSDRKLPAAWSSNATGMVALNTDECDTVDFRIIRCSALSYR